MVERLTYRKRYSYATKSNQHRVVKTPVASLFIRPQRRGPTDPSALSLERGFKGIFFSTHLFEGHRRTCIGVMPGKILGRGHAGDPASALLELLDPEQNANFLDHYLDVTIDLSKVVAIAGYITDEKMHIARDYLEKTIREACGIKPGQVEVSDAALLIMCGFINDY
ncbi:hypothetical protein JHK82_033730 [Glycine max]|nr:hypothetical protein JHK82_033730 [Glycine max]